MGNYHIVKLMCAILGKMSNEADKKGEAWISKEGIKKLIQNMDQ